VEDVEETTIVSKYKKDPSARWAVYSSIDVSYIYREDFRCMKRAIMYANRLRERGHKLSVGQYEVGKLEQYTMFWGLKS
jgi:hypothetical protein